MAENKSNPEQVADTGHEWDGIKELDNPCPRWWLNALYLSGVLVVAYFFLYPSLPLVNDSTKGLLGWTQIKEYKENLAEIENMRAPFEKKLANMTAEQILADQELRNYAIASSKVLYGDNCAPCHGIGGAPVESGVYPSLADDYWLYGGAISDIEMSIANGRAGIMPAHNGLLTDDEVEQLVNGILKFKDGTFIEADRDIFVAKGCSVCHGRDAKGNKAVGSANLTDDSWRFSADRDEISYTILHGVNDPNDPKTRIAIMPPWSEKYAAMLQTIAYAIEDGDDPNDIDWDDELTGDETERLSPTEIKKLAVRVHQFGGGQ